MGRVRNDKRNAMGRFAPAFETRPADFEITFVRIGRLACEEHYRVGRTQITRWLEDCGKHELQRKRTECVKANEAERNAKKRLSRRDMGRILAHAYPAAYVNPAVAQRAARHLRIIRNGGWIVSPIGGGLWRLGLRVVSASELVEVAKAKGFSANLPADE